MTILVEQARKTNYADLTPIPYVLSRSPDFLVVFVSYFDGTPESAATITWGGVPLTYIGGDGTTSSPAGSGRADIAVYLADVRNVAVPLADTIVHGLGQWVNGLAISGITDITLHAVGDSVSGGSTFPTSPSTPGRVCIYGIMKRVDTTLSEANHSFYPQGNTAYASAQAGVAIRQADSTTPFAWTPTATAHAYAILSAAPRKTGQRWPRGGNIYR